jgi:glucokinase
MNDLEATAYGALHTNPNEMQTLNEGISRPGNCAVIAAGTGLGQAFLFWDGTRYIAAATEGGHVDFAPRNALEDSLLGYMRKQYPTVSYERIVSGPGLVQICRFLVDEHQRPLSSSVRQQLQTEDPAAVIGQAGVMRTGTTCEEAIEIFLGIYGAQAGNLALTVMGLGGVYIGGGIITKLLPKVGQGAFLQAFQNKGRFSALMKEIPVRIFLNPKTSQIGAAQAAAELVR